MRRDRALLDDMIEAAARIGAIVTETNYQGLLLDEIRKAAILHHLAVIGEAAGRVSSELREKYPRIPWSQIMSQRNRVVHEYFGIDWALIWKTISEDLPVLRELLTEVQRIEFSEGAEE
jgi:uncharacterized protein with HEPN domain